MSRDTLYKQKFKCEKCSLEKEEYIWKSKLNSLKLKCTCKGKMKPIFEEKRESIIILGKMSTSQIQQDRKQRSRNHFKNEILPNIPNSTMEGKHFRKKYSKTGK